MVPSKLLGIFCLLTILGNVSCTENNLNLPEPAQSIEGTYEALTNSVPLPTQDQIVRLYIKRIDADSVEIATQATINGQPVNSLIYKKALVSQVTGRVADKWCVSCHVHVTSLNASELLTMTCKEESVFNYVYTPTGQQRGTTIKFKRI